MARRRRQDVACALATAVLATVAATPAHAQVTTDLNDFNLTESTSTYNGGATQFHISSSGGGPADYRWLDSPSKSTVISANACSDYTLYGSDGIPAGDTNYHRLYSGRVGECFVVRGRTTAGSGSMSLHDGRIRR